MAEIVEYMFRLLRCFVLQPGCGCIDDIVLFELKIFFIGFYDFLKRNLGKYPEDKATKRTNEVFSEFMELITVYYKISRDVSFYAEKLHISTRYLGQIVKLKTGHTPKTVIDHYVIMQLKLLLRTGKDSIKEIAWQYHFNDDSFFCRYFKFRTGVSPQQFRNRIT
ncbi:helix-turn-helix domain-containing protein [Hoylesella oralis]|uniref:helix-turn-helix domain-containing protein n=1 Tax=Hoylesella oralis TaxID=28134 RepID=UPI0028E47965|nr:helix-turn-helix domain-containing protein [Hoylesella oralis]